MDRYRILRSIVSGWVFISVICLFLSGCGEQPPEPPPKPKEVRKKIAARPGPPKTEPLAAADTSVTDKSPEGKEQAAEPGKTAPDSGKADSAPVTVADGKDGKASSKPEVSKPVSAQAKTAEGKGAKEASKPEEGKPQPVQTEGADGKIAKASSKPEVSKTASAQAKTAEGKDAKEVSKPEEGKPQPVQTEGAGDKDTKPAVKSGEDKAQSAQSVAAKDGKAGAKPGETKPESGQTAAAKTDTEDRSGEVEKSDASPPSDTPKNEEEGEDAETLAAISAMDPEDANKFTASYNPKGKVDPFEPLLREESKKPDNRPPEPTDDTASSKPKPPPRRLTPLEKLDLGQLKLVGIIRAESGNKALVEEASGKGYIIVKGTYIGIHSGVVVDILQDRVVVEEQDEDVLGKVTVRKRELKFNRPEGEDYYEM